MRKTILGMSIAVLAIVATSIATAGPRGPWQGSRGWSSDGAYGRMFDPKTITSISGEIVAFEQFTPMKGMATGVHMIVKTASERVAVHLGPSWYLASQDADLKVGDQVEVRGSRIQIDKKPAIIAVRVERGKDVLLLRDDQGFPRWAGWRRGRGPAS